MTISAFSFVTNLKGQFTTDERFDWSDDFNSRDSIVLQNNTAFANEKNSKRGTVT